MIEYHFKRENGETFVFKVDPDRESHAVQGSTATWTALAFHTCSNCPLSTSTHSHCPAAVDVENIVAQFRSDLSYEKVLVEVKTASRTYSQHTDMQTALRSLMGLVMATSGCPVLSRLKGLARSHLPFASLEETLFRSTGAYLLKQYFVLKEGGVPDFELRGLEKFYDDLQTVNRCFKRRVDSASERDANMNAIGSLIYVAMGVSFSIEDRLEEIRNFAIE